MYQRLLELIKLIFGKNAINKTIGTRTNVIKLPNNKTKRYTKQDLDIESASDAAAMNAKKEMEELIAEIPKMNDAERLIFEGNLQRLKNRLGIRSEKDPTADVYEFGTKLKATPKGIETLTEQAGQKSPPGTVMGNLESRLNRLRASGKDLGDIAKEEGGVKFSIPEKGIFNQELSADNLFDTIIKQQEKFLKIQNSGLVTSTAREILQRDIKAGKLKLPKEIEDRIMLVDGNPGTVNPVEVFRTNYGEDALEQVDSLIPELAKAQSFSDLVKIVEKKYPMKPLAKPRKETMSLDEATKAEEENILTPKKPDEPEEFAVGGRVGFKEGSGYFSNLIKENIPPEYRLYAKSILPGGKKGNVDESYFTEDFKKDLRQQVLTKFKETGKLKGSIGELDTHYRSGAKKYGQGEKYPINKLIGLPSTYATLGSYNYEIDPETLDVKIKDTYDWNPAYGKNSSSGKIGWVGDKKGKDVDTSMLKDYVMQSLQTGEINKGDALELLGNYLGPKASKGEGINVDIDIPAQDISMGEGETFATGGIVNRTGFKFGTKFGRFWKVARKVWDDINPTGDRKYDAQLVADELAEEIFKTSMDDLPQNVQIDLYALAYNNAPKVDALFRNPQSLSEAAKKGMAASKEMESLGLDVSKNSDFFKYEEMKLSGQLGPEHQVQAYKDKIRDEFYGMIDDTLMKQVEVDDNPQRLAEVYASIKEGLEMQRKGMTPEEIIRVMKQTPRTKNAIGGRVGYADGGSKGLDYLMGVDRKGYANGSLDEFLESSTLVSPSGKSYNYDLIKSLPTSGQGAAQKFGYENVFGKTGPGTSSGDVDTFTPGKYGSYYDLTGVGDAGTPSLKSEYAFIQDYILKPENLVRDYGLEGAIKILTPYRKTVTPAAKAAPAPVAIPTVGSSTASASASAPVENFINDAVGTGAKEDPILDKYGLFVQNYKPTAIPVSNYETFVDQTGILKPHIQTAFSGLSPFFKQQYQTFATANPEKALEAALQDLKFLVATGNRPSYLQDGGRVGFNEGTLDPAKEKQIKQMIKMGADVDTISAITGATPEQIQQVQQTPRTKNSQGGLNYLMGY